MAAHALAPCRPPSVVWNPDAVERIREDAIGGLLSLRKRGIEVGGLLLGTISLVDGVEVTRVESVCPISCEHSRGPGFMLSEADREHFTELLAQARSMGDSCVVGYYRSRTDHNRDFNLGAADLELIEAYFSDPSHIFLIVRPWNVRSCQAQLFRWHADQLAVDGEVFELSVSSEQQAPPPVQEPTQDSIQEPAPEPVIAVAPKEPVHVEQRALHAVEEAVAHEKVRQERAVRRELRIWQAATVLFATLAIVAWVAVPAKTNGSERGLVPLATIEPADTPVNADPPVAKAPESDVPLEQIPPPPPPAIQASPAPENPAPDSRAVPDRVVKRAAALEEIVPRVPEGIRNRLLSPLRVIVRVQIDEQGRVVKALPERYDDGLRRYLAQQAADAARATRFQPAQRASGAAAASTETLSFRFEPR